MDYRGLYDSVKGDPGRLQDAITKALKLTANDLHGGMLRQAQVFGAWGACLALSERDLKLQKIEVEETILTIARVAAEQVLLDSARKTTVQAKEDVARNDPAYKIANTGMIEQQMLTSVIKSTVEALRHKMNMMQSLNSRQKAELTAIPGEAFNGASEWERGVTPGDVGGDLYTAPDSQHGKSIQSASSEAEIVTELEFLAKRYRAQKRSAQ